MEQTAQLGQRQQQQHPLPLSTSTSSLSNALNPNTQAPTSSPTSISTATTASPSTASTSPSLLPLHEQLQPQLQEHPQLHSSEATLSSSSTSTSTSFDSSRPSSQQSSLTSAQSSPQSLDTTPKETAEAEDHKEALKDGFSAELLASQNNIDTEERGQGTNATPCSGSGSRHDSGATITAPTSSTSSVLPAPPSNVLPSLPVSIVQQPPRFFFQHIPTWLSRRQWFGNGIGLTTLVATLVGLLVFGYRTYKLDIYNSHMSYLQVCLGQVQINASIDSACQASVARPVPPSPYKLIERAFNATRAVYAGIIGEQELAIESTPAFYGAAIDTPEKHMDHLMPLLFILLPLALAAAVLIRHLRMQSRVQDVFSTSVRNEVQITRHHPDQGRAVTSEQGVRVIKHKPEEHHYLGQLRENLRHVLERDPSEERALGYFRRRKWKSIEGEDEDDSHVSWKPESNWGLGSESTLVSGWNEDRSGRRLSRVSIESNMVEEGENHQYEGLIELKTKGSNKTFFDPKTGEFIRLTPWKASAATGDDDNKIHGDEEGNTKKALARMGASAVALGGGKSVDEEIMEELDRDDILGIVEQGKVPQRAGDAMAGIITNESPSGKPIIFL